MLKLFSLCVFCCILGMLLFYTLNQDTEITEFGYIIGKTWHKFGNKTQYYHGDIEPSATAFMLNWMVHGCSSLFDSLCPPAVCCPHWGSVRLYEY